MLINSSTILNLKLFFTKITIHKSFALQLCRCLNKYCRYNLSEIILKRLSPAEIMCLCDVSQIKPMVLAGIIWVRLYQVRGLLIEWGKKFGQVTSLRLNCQVGYRRGLEKQLIEEYTRLCLTQRTSSDPMTVMTVMRVLTVMTQWPVMTQWQTDWLCYKSWFRNIRCTVCSIMN